MEGKEKDGYEEGQGVRGTGEKEEVDGEENEAVEHVRKTSEEGRI